MPVVTLAEIDATGRKAARGCGCPWGIAEEAGKSARWLAARGLPGCETLAAQLTNRRTCCTQTGAPCALLAGASLADRATLLTDRIDIREHDHPLLMVAQMGRAAEATGRSFTLTWNDDFATVTSQSLTLGAAKVTSTTKSCIVEDAAWAALKTLSHRTLVPATDASRAGAGAGTRDND